MGPLAPLMTEHAGLLRKLARYSFPGTAKIVGGLALCPELYAHLIRIEVLQHFVAMACVGTRTANREDTPAFHSLSRSLAFRISSMNRLLRAERTASVSNLRAILRTTSTISQEMSSVNTI